MHNGYIALGAILIVIGCVFLLLSTAFNASLMSGRESRRRREGGISTAIAPMCWAIAAVLVIAGIVVLLAAFK